MWGCKLEAGGGGGGRDQREKVGVVAEIASESKKAKKDNERVKVLCYYKAHIFVQ